MRVSATLLLLGLAAAARGADAPAPAADSIADAKKDLAAIKSPLKEPDAGASLPNLDMKDVSPGPGGGSLSATAPLRPDKDAALDPSKKKEGTGNWLVDAMDKKADGSQASRAKEKDDILRGDPDLLREDERLGARGEQSLEAMDESRDKDAPKEPAGPVYNPLDSFMSGWISARDHDLLLPSSKGDGLGGAAPEKTRSDTLPGLETGQPGSPAEGLLTPAESAAFSDSRALANPYVALPDLAPPPQAGSFSLQEIPGFPGLGPQETVNGLPSLGADARPGDNARTFIPDFAQPPDDDKYFKQMKRF